MTAPPGVTQREIKIASVMRPLGTGPLSRNVEQNKSVNNFSGNSPLKPGFKWSLLSTLFAK
jgi:hypothetical protein